MKNRIVYYIIVVIVFLYYLNFHYKIFAFSIGHNEMCCDNVFSIMTFNVDASDPDKFTDEYWNQLIRLLEKEHPDIVCFQELSFTNLNKIMPRLDSLFGPCSCLEEADKQWRSRFYSHYPLRNFKRYACDGLIRVNDLSEEEKSFVELSRKQMNVMSAEFEIEPNRWVEVFSGHFRSSAYSTARRSMDSNASWLDGFSLYKRNYEVGKRIRHYEAQNVRRFIDNARSSGVPLIVAGDLNDWCGSRSLNTLMGNDLKDSWWEGGDGFGWTFFGWNLRLRLDHILYSDEMELIDVKVVDSDLSDHKPLMASFRIK